MEDQYERKVKLYSWLRAIFFILWIYLLYQSTFYIQATVAFSFFLGLVGFMVLVSQHQKWKKKALLKRELSIINRDEIARLKGDQPHAEDGSSYIERSHAFTYDLDVFGAGSLFETISRCRIKASKDALANSLKKILSITEATERQVAIRQLGDQIKWIQEFEAGIKKDEDKQTKSFDKEPPAKPGKFVLFPTILLSGSSVALSMLWVFEVLPIGFLWIALLINGVFLSFFQKSLHSLSKYNHLVEKLSMQYLPAFQAISGLSAGNSKLLDRLKQGAEGQAIAELVKIKRLIYAYDNRSNMMYWLLNIFLLLDVYTSISIQNWLSRNYDRLSEWMDLVHQMEVLNSFAIYHFAHQDYSFPTLTDKESILVAKNVRHPLIKGSEVVGNDFSFVDQKIVLITGSNMSGKSTFLRTIGINVLMAWQGLPVAADEFTCSKYDLFCGMRTEDNLKEHTSSFYAELKRIKRLFEKIEEQENVLFFLDEILKGTNSKDRHAGAKGIINRLLKTSAHGFVSTHDLELSDEFSKEDNIKDFSFNSQLKENKLVFDYRLTSGKCTSTNASELLRIMGIA